MSHSFPKYSEDLLQQIGVQPWQGKKDFIFNTASLADSQIEKLEGVEIEESKKNIVSDSVDKDSRQAILPFILIGAGLDTIWQNEEKIEWQLLKNISKVFSWDLENLYYYDSQHIISEEAIYATLDEVMAIDVDWVLSMDTESLLSEHLSEGLQIISLPDLSQMLADPYAKKDCFLTLSKLFDS